METEWAPELKIDLSWVSKPTTSVDVWRQAVGQIKKHMRVELMEANQTARGQMK
jgi:hypothetical protein